jgi:16S rRNA (cytosine967-C5)-methyltransferase
MACYPQAMPDTSAPSSPPLSQALAAAAYVIAAVIGGRNLNRELGSIPASLRPAVQDLAYGALRQYGRGDALLTCIIPKPLADQAIRGLLLAALYRIDAQPDDTHTTVDQAVGAATDISNGRFKALVNAVLRNTLRQQTALKEKLLDDDVAHWQHPRWWIDRLRKSYPARWQDILAAGNARPPMTLRINRRRIGNINDYIRRLAETGIAARTLDGTAILLEKPLSVALLTGFAAGDVSVQDWGAQRAATLLDVEPGMRVLDACAAPGGKAAHIMELADVDMVALDADPQRLAQVEDNMRRLHLPANGGKASLKAADCTKTTTWWDETLFDRILADVPCSASGVIRRHPDAKWLRRESDVAGFAKTQARILDALWRVLKPGGKMLYCTCSVFAEENQNQINAFVSRHNDAQRLPMQDAHTELQLIPTTDHDGFYYALLLKHA